MPMRWLYYKQKRHHYFLLDFCYYTNTLLLIYFWSPWQPNWLFPTVFVFSHGPLLFAAVIWRNSIVPHSLDRMTSVFIHISPALTTWGTRWYAEFSYNMLIVLTFVGIQLLSRSSRSVLSQQNQVQLVAVTLD